MEVTVPIAGPISLSPSYGHMFGGTPVSVTGPYFTTSDTITCHYEDISVEAIYISDEQVLCVSPHLKKIGEVDFIVYVVANDGVTSRFDSTFSSSESAY